METILNGSSLNTIVTNIITPLITSTNKVLLRYYLIEYNTITEKYFYRDKHYIFDTDNISYLNLLDRPNKYVIYLFIKVIPKYSTSFSISSH